MSRYRLPLIGRYLLRRVIRRRLRACLGVRS